MPIFSASSSSLRSRASATSLDCRSSFAVGKPGILAFSSASYFIRLSRGDWWDNIVEGLRYDASTSLWMACEYKAGPSVQTISTPRRISTVKRRTFNRVVHRQMRHNLWRA